jgi:polysaccharide biosynthesis protein PslH
MHILYLTTVLPSQRKTGGEIASQCFIDALEKDGHQVTVVGYQRHGDTSTKKENEICIGSRHIETNKSQLYPFIWMGCGLIKNLPYSSAKYYSASYKNQIATLLKNQSFETLIIDHAQLGWLLPSLKKHFNKIIFIAHNIEHEIYDAQLSNPNSHLAKPVYRREAHRIKSIEDNLAENSQQVWTLTQHDWKYFQHINSATQVFDVPSALKTSPQPTRVKTCDVGIIGSWTWKANMQGLQWFFTNVYPKLPTNLSIRVAGKGAEWLDGLYPNVEYSGFVPDVQAFLTEAKTIAIPSISGGGIQIKTLDAIASGSPIVATPTALRGIFDYPSGIKVIKEADDFAHTLVEMVISSQVGSETLTKLHQERLLWSQNRYKKFIADVNQALLMLDNTKNKLSKIHL